MEKTEVVTYIVVPLLIFFARVLDVSVGTFRIILISRGNKILAPLLGFVEVMVWLLAITQVMKNLSNVVSYLAYGTGFATGNYVGMWLEAKLAMGLQAIRIITPNELESLPMVLRDESYAVTTVKGRGSKGPVNIIFTVVKRKDVKRVLDITKTMEPNAFITIEDIRSKYAGFIRSNVPFRVTKMK